MITSDTELQKIVPSEKNPDEMLVGRRIGIAMEESSAEYVFQWAMRNLVREGDDVYLLHCENDPAAQAPNIVSSGGIMLSDLTTTAVDEYQDKRREQESNYRHFVSEYNNRLKARNISSHPLLLRGEDARDALVDASKGLGLETLVVGTRCNGLVRRALLGSVSDYVVHHCKCAVTVVPRPGCPNR